MGPGETLTLELPLTAPEEPGTYTVYWTLQDANGAVVPVDGVQRVWATIRVCADGQNCSAPVVAAGGASASANGVSLTFVEVTHEGGMIFVDYCITVANPGSTLKYPYPKHRSIIVDGNEAPLLEGGYASPVYDPILGYNCFKDKTSITSGTFTQAQSVILRVGKVEGIINEVYERCEIVKPALTAQYFGLDFQCDLGGQIPYTGLQLPAGMSADEAHLIIVDAINGAIYGPWDLTIK